MATQNINTLNLDQNVEAIKFLDLCKPAYKVAEIYGVSKTQIQNLRKRKLGSVNRLLEQHIRFTKTTALYDGK